ncbi:unnamed protein product, partial [marine sediment metagenome]
MAKTVKKTVIIRYRCPFCAKFLPKDFDLKKIPRLKPWANRITFEGQGNISHEFIFPNDIIGVGVSAGDYD